MNTLQAVLHSQIISSLKQNHQSRFRVTGRSMRPLIQKGDWVVVEPLTADSVLLPGEIVLIDRTVDFVVHRFIKKNKDVIFTRGDWSRSFDPPVKHEQILGRVIVVEKRCCNLRLSHPLLKIVNRLIIYASFLYQKK